jgi:subtilisin family serine protease
MYAFPFQSSLLCNAAVRNTAIAKGQIMRRLTLVAALLLSAFWTSPVQAAGRLIVRVDGGLSLLKADCLIAGCTVSESIDGSLGQVFLVTAPDAVNLNSVLQLLSRLTGIVNVEVDQIVTVADSSTSIPPALYDNTPVSFYGSTVPHGYVNQPATQIIGLPETNGAFPNVSGSGTVAVIDTGVDPNHPALQRVLLRGYDFTRNQNGANELLDISLSNPPVIAGSNPRWVRGDGSGRLSQSTAAVVDQSTAAVVDGNPSYSDFGHGTMVAGIIHLVAPTANILPLKSFRADGTGYNSDILRAIYYATAHDAKVLNMSFNLATYSQEVATALNLATLTGTISVAAAGNNSSDALVYPAALSNVIGVASTSNTDQLSSFSNYGPNLVWVGAPGEGIVTTYPFSTYAAGWGTSFSTPFVSGTAALLVDLNPLCDQYSGAQSTAHAQPIDPNVGNGRLALLDAMTAWSHGQ